MKKLNIAVATTVVATISCMATQAVDFRSAPKFNIEQVQPVQYKWGNDRLLERLLEDNSPIIEAEAPAPMYATQELEVKDAPTEDSRTIATYQWGEEVHTIGSTGPSALVQVGDEIGYVDLSELSDTQPTPTPDPRGTYLGTCRLTFYCRCSICNGEWGGEHTAMGTPLTDGQTIAVDKSVIPLGSHVYIDGYGERIAEDTGSPSCIYGTNIDVFVDVDHDTCESMGVEYRDVWIK